ncbi:siderophore-binding protein DesE [Glycomyces halotolerans]
MAFDVERARIGRRGLLAGGGALGLAGALAACGGSESDAEATEESGPWSFTDDRPEEVELDAVPADIVAYTGMAAALHDFGITVPAVFGPTTLEDGSPTGQAGNLPVGELEIIGNTYGEFDLKDYAEFGPELVLTHFYDNPEDLWYILPDIAEEVTGLAPVVALCANDGQNTLPQVIERHAALAASLGADLESDTVTAAKERFDAAVSALTEAAAANPVKVLCCSAYPETFYASNPGNSNDTRFYTELGVDFVVPDNLDEGDYFESLSWENADKYQADLLFLDARELSIQPEGLTEFPTWNALPAVQAGQILGWNSEPIYSYEHAAASIEALAEAIAGAEKVV